MIAEMFWTAGSHDKQPDSATSKIRKPQFKPPPPNRAKSQLDRDDNTNTDTDTEVEEIPPPRRVPPLPSNPLTDPDSPFLDSNGLFLRYPSTQSSLPAGQAPQNARTDTNHNTPSVNPDVPPPAPSLPRSSQLHAERSLTHISTSSKSLGDPISTGPPDRQAVHAERSLTHISTSSRSLGDRVQTPALGQGVSRRSVSQTQALQHSDHPASQLQGSEPAAHAPSSPPESPSAVTRKGTTGRSGSRGRFLDMALINSQRALVRICYNSWFWS